jgi:hypothetical protein
LPAQTARDLLRLASRRPSATRSRRSTCASGTMAAATTRADLDYSRSELRDAGKRRAGLVREGHDGRPHHDRRLVAGAATRSAATAPPALRPT